jgi:hypothetical protein
MRQKETHYSPISHNSVTAEMLARSHTCFSCLIGSSPEKRACARESLRSEGLSDALIHSLSPSFKTEH